MEEWRSIATGYEFTVRGLTIACQVPLCWSDRICANHGGDQGSGDMLDGVRASAADDCEPIVGVTVESPTLAPLRQPAGQRPEVCPPARGPRAERWTSALDTPSARAIIGASWAGQPNPPCGRGRGRSDNDASVNADTALMLPVVCSADPANPGKTTRNLPYCDTCRSGLVILMRDRYV